MPTNVLLPQWGRDMTGGRLVRWLVQDGDTVTQGQPLAEVETFKVISELEASASGVIAHILVPEGETADVGALLAVIVAPGEADQPTPEIRGPAAPALARAPAAPGRVVRLNGLRATIAGRMLESLRTSAQVTLTTEADVTEMVRLREELVERWRPQELRPQDLGLIVRATAETLKEHPGVNALLVDDELRLLDQVNIGVAATTPDGLMVPVVHDAARPSMLEMVREVRDLIRRARDHTLSVDDVSGGSFTITSMAAMEVDAFTPILNPPQVAILGVGRVREKPAVHDGEVRVRRMMAMSLTFDHRALDGAPAGAFLRDLKRRLESPRWMVE